VPTTRVEAAAAAALAALNNVGAKPSTVPATERDLSFDVLSDPEGLAEITTGFNVGIETVDQDESPDTPYVTRTVQFLISVGAPVKSGARPSTVVDESLAWFAKAIHGTYDESTKNWLGGVSLEVRELGLIPVREFGITGGRAIYRSKKGPICIAVLVFEVKVITKRTDPTAG
jgi:hypothetical protein